VDNQENHEELKKEITNYVKSHAYKLKKMEYGNQQAQQSPNSIQDRRMQVKR
jgi:hypothetical protein